MPMSAIIKEKRKELGLTQEQVADYLGVSAPAVNKWEKGATYPDVNTLPALARLLKTDINTLLCFHENLSKKELGLFMEEVTNTVQNMGLEQGFLMAKSKVCEYPACAELLHTTAILLQGLVMMWGMELPPEQKKPYEDYITSLYKRVVQCEDETYSFRAKYMLASRLIMDGDYGRAQEMLDVLPEYVALDKRDLQVQLFMIQERNQDAAVILERKLLQNIQENMIALDKLSQIAVREGDVLHAEHLAQCSHKEMELFGMWSYGAYVVSFQVAVSQKDKNQSLAILKSMLDAMMTPWDMAKSPIYQHINQNPQKEANINLGKKLLPALLKELETNPEYDFLRQNKEFQDILEAYRTRC